METKNLNQSVPQEQFNINDVEITDAQTNVSAEESKRDVEQDVDFSDEEASIHANAPEFELQDSEVDNEHSVEDSGAFIDFAGKSKKEINDLFESILKTKPVQAIRREAEAAKVAFYKIYRAEVEQTKKEFIADGKPAEEFIPMVDDQEERLKYLFAEYRRHRNSYIENLEHQKEQNYAVKLKIIEELKDLINSNETLNQTFNTFRELQNAWKEAGAVPQTYVKDIWETYHLHVENFYNFIKINNELRDLDLKRNAEAKIRLCEEAEELLLETSAISAFHKLQKLHEQWREIGPVSNEYKEQLWERFKDVSGKINKRHQDYFETIKDEQKRNLELKTELCIKTEELLNQKLSNRSDWDKASEELIEIQKVWKTIGFAPKKDNTLIYERFRAACDKFFENKRTFYINMKSEMDENLQAKIDICIIAESFQDSDDWKKTTEELIALQKKWKDIGVVSRKHSDIVWKRFRKACDNFFNKKTQHFSQVDSKYDENLIAKKILLEEIKAFEITERESGFESLKDFQRRWAEIGFVPIKEKDKLQNEYRLVIDQHFSTLKGGEKERKIEKFKDKITTLKSGKNKGSVRNERERLFTKVRQLETDIALLENNIGFFAKSKNAESMIKDVRNKIAKAKEEMAISIDKITMIDSEGE